MTIEQRKAAALKWIVKSDLKGGHFDLIRELLAPSPQSPDGEVDEAKKYNMREAFADSKLGMNAWLSYETLLKKAQQPRQEWVDVECAFKNGWVNGSMTAVTEGKLSGEICESDWKNYKNKISEPPKDAK